MSYLATVTGSLIDTTNIKNLLVQGESTHPQIVFSLSPTLTGLSWKVRMAYLSFNLAVESAAIAPTEGAQAVTITWTPDASFTTLYGAAQVSLVGTSGATTVVRAVGYINIARDWSGESQGTVTLDLFEQTIAQASAAIANYPYVDETTGNWFAWNPNAGVYENSGYSASPKWITGTGITGTSTTPTAFAGSGITMSNAGDMYLNTSTANTYKCTLGGNAATALWAYVSNIKGAAGDPGAGVPVGGTTDQVLAKNSATNYDMKWLDVLSVERTATLSAGSWSGSSAPYSQAVTVTGVTVAGKPPIIDVVLSDTYATAMSELTAYGLVYRFKVTADNTVTAYATSVPSVAINIHAKLVM